MHASHVLARETRRRIGWSRRSAISARYRSTSAMFDCFTDQSMLLIASARSYALPIIACVRANSCPAWISGIPALVSR